MVAASTLCAGCARHNDTGGGESAHGLFGRRRLAADAELALPGAGHVPSTLRCPGRGPRMLFVLFRKGTPVHHCGPAALAERLTRWADGLSFESQAVALVVAHGRWLHDERFVSSCVFLVEPDGAAVDWL